MPYWRDSVAMKLCSDFLVRNWVMPVLLHKKANTSLCAPIELGIAPVPKRELLSDALACVDDTLYQTRRTGGGNFTVYGEASQRVG